MHRLVKMFSRRPRCIIVFSFPCQQSWACGHPAGQNKQLQEEVSEKNGKIAEFERRIIELESQAEELAKELERWRQNAFSMRKRLVEVLSSPDKLEEVCCSLRPFAVRCFIGNE